MMHSKSFDTQEVREIGQKEAGESIDFSILRMGIMERILKRNVKSRKD